MTVHCGGSWAGTLDPSKNAKCDLEHHLPATFWYYAGSCHFHGCFRILCCNCIVPWRTGDAFAFRCEDICWILQLVLQALASDDGLGKGWTLVNPDVTQMMYVPVPGQPDTFVPVKV